MQFGKGYKRKIYDNALCVEGGLPPRGVDEGGRWGLEIAPRVGRGA